MTFRLTPMSLLVIAALASLAGAWAWSHSDAAATWAAGQIAAEQGCGWGP